MHALFLRKLRRKQLSGKRILWGYLRDGPISQCLTLDHGLDFRLVATTFHGYPDALHENR